MTKANIIYSDLSYNIQGCFFNIYNNLGFGHKEIIYQRALEKELKLKNISFKKEPRLFVTYLGEKMGIYVPDFVIDDKIIIEIKAVEFLPSQFIQQLIYYLKGTGFSLGYLVNFGSPKLQIIRRIWTPKPTNRIREDSLSIRVNPT